MRTASERVIEAAERLVHAQRTGIPCAPVRDLIGGDELATAYAVQQRLIALRLGSGAQIVGRKIGLTSPAVQRQLGVDQPDFGVLFDDMAYEHDDVIPAGAVLQPRVEAEVAFVLGADLDSGDLDVAQVRSSVDYAMAALEICGSRIADWDITFGDTVADNASAGAYVLGTERRTLDEFEPRAVEMTLAVDRQQTSTGSGAACLGDPLLALQWLAQQARDLGDPLRAGQIVLSGALGPMRPLGAGGSATATLSTLGSVSVHLGAVEGGRA